ncbi:MAG TPA: hypothetical protein VFS43_14630 [Polyangiaceae bacterium]|nr:hypothetical protein [Polyangiaceae bacterium]
MSARGPSPFAAESARGPSPFAALSARGHSPFVAPLPLGAVALMAVNDRWLKPAYHNAWTGKLSDVAICFFLPLYVAALVALAGRAAARLRAAAFAPMGPARAAFSPAAALWLGALATAAVFVPIKLSPAAAEHFCAALAVVGRPLGLARLRCVADPTDLLALPFVGLALAYGRRRGEGALPRRKT